MNADVTNLVVVILVRMELNAIRNWLEMKPIHQLLVFNRLADQVCFSNEKRSLWKNKSTFFFQSIKTDVAHLFNELPAHPTAMKNVDQTLIVKAIINVVSTVVGVLVWLLFRPTSINHRQRRRQLPRLLEVIWQIFDWQVVYGVKWWENCLDKVLRLALSMEKIELRPRREVSP